MDKSAFDFVTYVNRRCNWVKYLVMKQATHKTLYNTHGWIGIVSGILLFVVIFSGIPALFEDELEYWQSPSLTALPKSQQFDLQSVVDAAHEENFIYSDFFISPANDVRSHHILWNFDREKEAFNTLFLAAHDNRVVEADQSDSSHILAHLHTDLHLPSPYGRYLIGLAGMAMLLAIIAGVVIHIKWRKELITLRPKRSWRLLLTDHHKILGLWTLPFTLVLAFTGTILGLLGLISPILALAAFDGDVEKATRAILGPKAEIIGEPLNRYPLNDIHNTFKNDMPGVTVNMISFSGYGDRGGYIKFSGNHDEKLNNLQATTYKMATGEPVHTANFIGNGPFQRIFAAVVPLHYVMYGGGWLKLFYALSALAVCGLIISGNMLWVERRGHSQEHWLGKLTLGVCGGLVLATLSLLSSSTWLRHVGADQAFWEETIFWAVWVITTLVALKSQASFSLAHGIIRLAMIISISTLIGDGIMNQRWIWTAEGWVLFVQFGLLIFTGILFVFDYLLPASKTTSEKNKPTAQPITS